MSLALSSLLRTQNVHMYVVITAEFTELKKSAKIPRAFWYHGNVSLTLGNNLVASLKMYLYIQKRYGHPDIQILATLKQKIWILRF